MTALDPQAAYALWSETYDADLNPILALEHRLLREHLHLKPGMRVLDLATGTGRWLEYSLHQGANAIGLDLSREMLMVAARKTGLHGRLIEGSLESLPFADQSADLGVCSFSLGYVPWPCEVFKRMRRVARRVIVSDLHPEALRAVGAIVPGSRTEV